MNSSTFRWRVATTMVAAAMSAAPLLGFTAPAHASINDVVPNPDNNGTLGLAPVATLVSGFPSGAAIAVDVLANDNLTGLDASTMRVETSRNGSWAGLTGSDIVWDPVTRTVLAAGLDAIPGESPKVGFDYRICDSTGCTSWVPVTLDVDIVDGTLGSGVTGGLQPVAGSDPWETFHAKIQAGEPATIRLDFGALYAGNPGRFVMNNGAAPWEDDLSPSSRVTYDFDYATGVLTVSLAANAGWIDDHNRIVGARPTPGECDVTDSFRAFDMPRGSLYDDGSATYTLVTPLQRYVATSTVCRFDAPVLAPVARDDNTEVRRGETRVVNVLKNDVVNGDRARVSIVRKSLPKGVAAKVDAKGRVHVTVTKKVAKTSFRYKLTNDAGNSDTATVHVAVMPTIVTGAEHDVPVTDAAVAEANGGASALPLLLGGAGLAALLLGGAHVAGRRSWA